MTDPSSEELAGFLGSLRAGHGPVSPLSCGRAQASFHTEGCDEKRAAALARIANSPLPGLTLYKFGSRSIVGSFQLPDGSEAVLKYYYPSNPGRHLAYGIRGSRCHQSWVAGVAFHHLRIPTPAPLIIAEWRLLGGLWLSKSFLATAKAEGISLREFVKRHGEDEARLTGIAGQLKTAFALMARHRIIHGDMKASNILIDEAAGDAVTFIDLDGAELLMPPARWTAAREKDRRRFAKNWNGLPTAARVFKDVFGLPPSTAP